MLRAAAVFVLMVSACAHGASNTDIVELRNGDTITGEVASLERGRLHFKTDSMGTVKIEWEDVARIESPSRFEVETREGTRLLAQLAAAEKRFTVALDTQERGLASFVSDRVVKITPMQEEVTDRIEGSLSFGFSYNKSSQVSQGHFSSAFSYRQPEQELALNLSSTATRDAQDETTQRSDFGLSLLQYRSDRWFNAWLARLERNDELGLDARFSLGAGIGRYLVQTNHSEFAAVAGLNTSRESLAFGADTELSVEGLLGVTWSRYIFDNPDVDISAQLTVYPSFTDSGRVRSSLDARVRYELIEDLFLDLEFYNAFDSDPPSGVDEKNDYGVVTSVGWSF